MSEILQHLDGELPAAVAAELGRLRAENARLLRLLKLTPQEAARGQVVRTHPQQPAGGRVSDPADFPPGTGVYARRDVGKLAKMAAARGEAIGIYAKRILDIPRTSDGGCCIAG